MKLNAGRTKSDEWIHEYLRRAVKIILGIEDNKAAD
jgi:hypothetical protein